ncbi:PREDICTED: zinc finger MYM-type protein 1-like [Priapulus caudatus]|uniref:Zinc finger MYM-type protein 1-like n=1 Tax=Priapulus caudatus TaxID=37621 RepID=A0ABM1ESF0_PRICU|nr:PREDICTED: zinc finger MYM-type protein 1-like [Priapulus caudatus]
MSEDRHKSNRVRMYLSGAEKRKRAKDKKDGEKVEVNKSKKLSHFFPRVSHVDGSCSQQPSTSKDAQSDTGVLITTGSADKVGVAKEHVDADITDDQDDGFQSDIGRWPVRSSQQMVEYWVNRGSSSLRNMSGPFVASVRSATGPQGEGHSGTVNRFCTKSFFERTLPNGEMVPRSWLCYSLSTCHVYCFACKLSNSTGNLATVGYGDWKHAKRDLEQHERSTSHCWNVIQLAKRASASCRIDEIMIRHANEVESYWCQVLKRCVSVISFLAERGLAFRGTDEIVGSHNNGNYLGLMELLAQYDSFLAQHVQQHANKGTGHTNYLSSTTCEELIAIMGTHVLDNIVGRVKEAKYFSVTVDSTPDASHVDQLTCVLRYMKNETPVERFVHFFNNAGHTGQDQANSLLRFLEANGIDIANCRGSVVRQRC